MKKYLLAVLFISLLQACGMSEDTRVKLKLEQPVLPVLVKKEVNPLIRLDLIRQSDEAYEVRKIDVSLLGTTDLNDIASIGLYRAGKNGLCDPQQLIEVVTQPKVDLSFLLALSIQEDTCSVWIAASLKPMVDLNHTLSIACKRVETEKGVLPLPVQKSSCLRMGVALRQAGQDGVHTSRIPGLATSKKGTLLAIYDARWDMSRDLQGDIDIALNRSFDGGLTWEPMQIVLDMKEWGGLAEKYNGVSDAGILVDDRSGDIYVAGLWMYGVLDGETGKWVPGMTADSTRWIHQWQRKGSQPGLDVKQTSQFLIARSSDDGQTWSEPLNITKETKNPAWWLYAPAPGHGITLRDGTLLFPTQGRDKTGEPFSNITWSKDGGKTWHASKPAYTNVTECMAVELSDGSVMLNMRDNRNRGKAENNGRRICVTTDLGETWTEHPTSRNALIEPTCMASIHRHTYQQNGEEKSILLFVNPSSISKRNDITLKVSLDDGQTWPEKYWILLDEYTGRGYSCITSVDEENIGILYESSQADMVFQRFTLKEILDENR